MILGIDSYVEAESSVTHVCVEAESSVVHVCVEAESSVTYVCVEAGVKCRACVCGG